MNRCKLFRSASCVSVVSVFLLASAAFAEDSAPARKAGDPPTAMQRGREIKENVDHWGGRLRKRCQEVEKILAGLDLKKIEGQHIAKDVLVTLLEDLDLEAGEILDAHSSVALDLRLYRKALDSAPASLESMAAEMEKRAEQVQSEQLKGSYADFAAMVRKMGKSYQDKGKAMDQVESTMNKQIEFVKESRKFLADVRELLMGLPTEDGLETERWVARVNQYIEAFQQVIKLIKQTGEKIGNEPRPTQSPGATPAREQAATPIRTAADYRQRVAALRPKE